MRKLRIAVRLWDWSEWCRQIIRGVQRFAHERPNWTVLADVGPTSMAVIPRRSQFQVPIDGAILAVLFEVSTYRRMLRAGKPKLVTLTATVPASLSAVPAVRVDEAKVAAAIGRHLLSGGFRRLIYCADQRPGNCDYRARAVMAFAQANGCPCDLYSSDTRPGATNTSARMLVRKIERQGAPVGVIAWNMDLARRVVHACQSLGVAVPERAAVVAWDDDVMLAESAEPTISAAVMPAERLGYEAARLLDHLLGGGAPPPEPLLIDPPAGLLHVRQSSDVSTIRDRDVWLAMQYIRERSTEPLKVPQIARTMQMSRRKLEQEFKKVTGTTLRDAIVSVRIERAKQLLLETDWPLDRVAERSGLSSRQTLHNVFVSKEGMTPAEYRKRFCAVD